MSTEVQEMVSLPTTDKSAPTISVTEKAAEKVRQIIAEQQGARGAGEAVPTRARGGRRL